MKKTLLFGFILSFLFGAVFAQEPVPNGSFENWETHALGTFDNPTGWDTPNASVSLADTINVRKSDDAIDGDYSVKMETIVLSLGPVDFITPGVITLGKFEVDYVNNTATFEGGVPFTSRPLALKGSMKNMPAAGDFAMVGAIFTKYNAAEGKRDTIGGGLLTVPETYTDWTSFSMPIQFGVSDNPDTINIYALSSNIMAPAAGGVTYLDNLSFEYEAGIADLGNTVETSIFPNPASDNITFRFEEELDARLNIYSTDGQMVYKGEVSGSETSLDVSSYANGTYYFAVYEENKKVSSGQFLISR